MRYILASNNPGKLREMKAILAEIGAEVVSQREAGADFEAEETGETFEENALIKARAACAALGEPAIADDSGLCVDALGGAPGVYSARYGGCETDSERTALLLKNLGDAKDRSAKFVSCIACVFPNGDVLTARGECPGIITTSPRGDGGFGYDPVFELPGTGKTMSELTEEEKNAVSHRGRALKSFQKKLREYNAHK
ncbi:MAG: XTP/dITP diphosphatase [Oscillospiraceae bacterium]|jgi:XTP/dITP diphosphohydrolase